MLARCYADLFLNCLAREGVRHLFLVPGAHLDPLLVSLSRQSVIQAVVCSHELGAAFMADGYARMREGIGACASIGGPGAANMAAGAYTANRHGVPVLYLTGDTATEFKYCDGFQSDGMNQNDARLIGIAAGSSHLIDSPQKFSSIWPEMLGRLRGRPAGPVHVEAPFDVLAGPAGPLSDAPAKIIHGEISSTAARRLRELADRLAGLTRIAVLAGPELDSSEGAGELSAFSREFSLPVATTADVPGVFLEPGPLRLGSFGYGGSSRATSVLLDEALEALIVVGAGLNERNTLRWMPRLLRRERRLMHVRSVALGPPDDRVRSLYVEANCADALKQLREWRSGPMERVAATAGARRRWIAEFDNLAVDPPLPSDATTSDRPGVHPAVLVREMRRCLPDSAVLFVDSGLHRLFAYHYWLPRHRLGLMTAARTAPTGWAICAGIGASLVGSGGPVVVLTGDGCMLMHGNELATAARYRAPVLFVVSNNGASGNIFRRLKKNGPSAAELGRLPSVDWAAFARAMGVPASVVRSPEEISPALKAATFDQGPYLIEVRTPAECDLPIPEHAVTSCNVEFIQGAIRETPRRELSDPHALQISGS